MLLTGLLLYYCFWGKNTDRVLFFQLSHILPAGCAACPGICPNKQDGQVLPNSMEADTVWVWAAWYSVGILNGKDICLWPRASEFSGEFSC